VGFIDKVHIIFRLPRLPVVFESLAG